MSDKDTIDRELEQLSADSGVEAELETLKSEVGGAESESASEVDEEERTDLETGDQEDVEAEIAELQDDEQS